MPKFRFHRASLGDSMATSTVVKDKQDLFDKIMTEYSHIPPYCPEYPHAMTIDGLEIKKYRYDPRIDWDTYIVTMNKAAIGFMDGNFEENTRPHSDDSPSV